MKKYIYSQMFALILVACGDSDDNKVIPAAPAPEATGTFTDQRDGNQYGWVRYGGTDWMSENLRYETTEGYCIVYKLTTEYQGGEFSNDWVLGVYGYLYDYQAAETACPDGWRLPTDRDWQNLEKVFGMKEKELESLDYRGDYQGLLMQDPGGLNLLLGGWYSAYALVYANFFRFHGVYGYYWTSTHDTNGFYFFRKITSFYDQIYRESTMDNNRLNVRCVRDASN